MDLRLLEVQELSVHKMKKIKGGLVAGVAFGSFIVAGIGVYSYIIYQHMVSPRIITS